MNKKDLILIIVILGLHWFNEWFKSVNPGFSINYFGQQGRASIEITFSTTEDNFKIFPSKFTFYSLSSGRLIIASGIKNNAEDNQSHDFVINVIPSNSATNSWPTLIKL